MRNKSSTIQMIFANIYRELYRLRADRGGNIAVMMAFLLPVIAGGLGLGYEVSNWYLQTRAMQNAADFAAIAASANGSSNYDVEAKAVTAQYGFVDGTNNVTVTASNTAACPAGGNTCYSVTISSLVPLYLSQVIGYFGDTTVNGAKEKALSSVAIAQQTTVQQPICLLALSTFGTALRTNGAPNSDFTGCSIMSNSAATCNGSNLKANYGFAAGTNNGCGGKQISNVLPVIDPYSGLASNMPNNLADASHCNGSYPQETKKGSHYSGGAAWSGSKTLTGTASVAGNTLICGDLQLTGNVTINTASAGAVLYIQNGQLDLNGYTLRTANGSEVTVVFTGTNGSYTHAPTDNSGGGDINIQAPTSGPWPGVAIYQDPRLTTGVDVTYQGNNPKWDVTGLVYLPHAAVNISGDVGQSQYGADCFVMVADTVLINGTSNIYRQSPNGAGCQQAGLIMPTSIIPGRGQLVY
jgi:Flp pilus assembly protein TadG